MINRSEKDIIENWPEGIKDNPMCSIRCMTYNHAKYISAALDGFLMQKTVFPFEIIVHDDASTDNTQDIIREYYQCFPNIIKPIFQTENQYSKPNGRNHLKDLVDGACKGKYIAWCEGDDYWIDDLKLQKQISYLEANPECSMVFNSANYVNDNGEVFFCDKKKSREYDYDTNKVIRGGGLFCASPSICLRNEYSAYLYNFQKLADIGDYPLQIALSLKGKVHYIPAVMSAYRVSESNKDSWTNRVMNNRDAAIIHLLNEINWLSELNKETNYLYANPIAFRNYVTKELLCALGALGKEELKQCFNCLCLADKLRVIKRRVIKWLESDSKK